jgi:hypothetical protein
MWNFTYNHLTVPKNTLHLNWTGLLPHPTLCLNPYLSSAYSSFSPTSANGSSQPCLPPAGLEEFPLPIAAANTLCRQHTPALLRCSSSIPVPEDPDAGGGGSWRASWYRARHNGCGRADLVSTRSAASRSIGASGEPSSGGFAVSLASPSMRCNLRGMWWHWGIIFFLHSVRAWKNASSLQLCVW